MEAQIFAQPDEKMTLVKASCRRALVPDTADINHKAAITGEKALEMLGKAKKPIHILAYSDGAIRLLLLEGQREWRRSYDQINRLVRKTLHYIEGIPEVSPAKLSFVEGFSDSGHDIVPKSNKSTGVIIAKIIDLARKFVNKIL
jgi:hypothetical protein